MTVLPLLILAGGLAFVPWRREHWRWATLGSRVRRHRWPLLGAFALVLLDAIETALDPLFTRVAPWDATSSLASLESGVHAALQAALPAWMPLPLSVVYLVGFPFLVGFTLFFFAWLDEGVNVKRAFVAFALCYLFALPFFVFLPVSEVWTTGAAYNLLSIHGQAADRLREWDGVDNNFPSLHTAISVAIAYVAWRSHHRAYARFSVVLAAFIVASTVLLGIHWVTDVAAGLALGAIVAWLVDRWVPVAARESESATTAGKARGDERPDAE